MGKNKMIKLIQLLKEMEITHPSSIKFDFKYEGYLYVLKNLRFEINYTYNGKHYEDIIKMEAGQVLEGLINSNGDAYCGSGVLIPSRLCKIMTNTTGTLYPKNIDPNYEYPLKTLDDIDFVNQQIKQELQYMGMAKPQII
jgi:hypothetical protein